MNFQVSIPANKAARVVLVVEDSRTDQLFIKRVLESREYHVLLAGNGKAGMEILHFCLEKNLNLVGIISDIAMPKEDGLEFLKKVKNLPGIQDVPVLLVTGVDAGWVGDGKQHGAEGLLHKPLTPDGLLSQITKLFRQRPEEPRESRVNHIW
jgi:CheY-like chemotaxis protein